MIKKNKNCLRINNNQENKNISESGSLYKAKLKKNNLNNLKEKKEKIQKIHNGSLEELYIKDDIDKNIFNQEKTGNNIVLKFPEKFQNRHGLKINNSFNFFTLSKNRIKNTRILNNISININSFFLKTIINYFIMMSIILSIYTKEITQSKIKSYFSNITLKIIGSGEQIFLGNMESPPDKVYINNNIELNPVSNKYNFEENENFVKLIWNDKISNCNSLFYGCSNVVFIDLTNFDFSLSISANCMFWGCSSLKEIIFPKSRRITINIAGGMFSGCTSLTSLDASHFDISSAQDFGNMFKNCYSLTSLDLTSNKIIWDVSILF